MLRAELPGDEAAGHAEKEAREELLPALEELVRVHVARREEEQAAQGRQRQVRPRPSPHPPGRLCVHVRGWLMWVGEIGVDGFLGTCAMSWL